MRLDHRDEIGEPCRAMEPLLQRTADGSANWLVRAYALAHAARCGRCGRFLANLQTTLGHLRTSRETVPPEVASRLEEALARAAEETGGR